MSTPKTALIDSDFLLYSVGFTTEDDTVGIAKSRLTEWLTTIVYIDLGCDDYEAYITGKGNFRYEVAKTVGYKANRKDAKKPKHFDALREHLQRLGAVEVCGIEADDMVAMKMTQEPGKYVLVGVDKDLLQIEGHHFNPVTGVHKTITEFEGAYNFWTQMLTGDRVDNVPGIRGIGSKKAEKILKDCHDYSSMESTVWKVYQDKGHDVDYFIEQGKLLWLQRYEGEQWSPKLNVEKLIQEGSTLTGRPRDVSESNLVLSRQD